LDFGCGVFRKCIFILKFELVRNLEDWCDTVTIKVRIYNRKLLRIKINNSKHDKTDLQIPKSKFSKFIS
jgi:hypothetical protein